MIGISLLNDMYGFLAEAERRLAGIIPRFAMGKEEFVDAQNPVCATHILQLSNDM
jgi:hypothetical protein